MSSREGSASLVLLVNINKVSEFFFFFISYLTPYARLNQIQNEQLFKIYLLHPFKSSIRPVLRLISIAKKRGFFLYSALHQVWGEGTELLSEFHFDFSLSGLKRSEGREVRPPPRMVKYITVSMARYTGCTSINKTWRSSISQDHIRLTTERRMQTAFLFHLSAMWSRNTWQEGYLKVSILRSPIPLHVRVILKAGAPWKSAVDSYLAGNKFIILYMPGT